MDGREHSPEMVWRAQELYCVDRLTYQQVADRIGQEIEPVAVSTLKRWGQTFEWSTKREELARALADISADTIMARSKLLKSLVAKPDAQIGFAVSSLETLAMKQAEAARAGRLIQTQLAKPKREIKTRKDAAEALREAVEYKLALMLNDPTQVSFRAVVDLKKALEMLTEIEPKEDGKSNGPGGTSAELDRKIQELLGYKI
ncbi:hypothetical protein [uncultured Pseudodesulfovibrio sp.]|uniref:hypothetical protein n=1 Tax=uncultured Pseudodesulfovibrio sp. TaxID=2035858 RepID=UPI0029C74339|nr:hypothetical protein [uncultured Pseudodesulfovibrio sp.]